MEQHVWSWMDWKTESRNHEYHIKPMSDRETCSDFGCGAHKSFQLSTRLPNIFNTNKPNSRWQSWRNASTDPKLPSENISDREMPFELRRHKLEGGPPNARLHTVSNTSGPDPQMMCRAMESEDHELQFKQMSDREMHPKAAE